MYRYTGTNLEQGVIVNSYIEKYKFGVLKYKYSCNLYSRCASHYIYIYIYREREREIIDPNTRLNEKKKLKKNNSEWQSLSLPTK